MKIYPVQCLPGEISVALISLWRSIFNWDLTPMFFIIHGVQNNKSQRQTPKLSKQEVVAVPSFYFFQSTIVNHKSSIPMRSPLHARSISQRY